MPDEEQESIREEPGHDRAPAPHYKRLLATLLDLLLAVLLIGLLVFLLVDVPFTNALRYASGLTLEVIAVHFLVRFLCLFLWARTPGMLLLRMRLLNGEGESPSMKERLLAGCFILYQGVDYYNS